MLICLVQGQHDKMDRTKTNTQNDTKTRHNTKTQHTFRQHFSS